MVAAAALVLDDDGIGRGTANGYGLAIDQTKDVGPLRAFANNQVRCHRIANQTRRRCRYRPPAHRECASAHGGTTGRGLPSLQGAIQPNAPYYKLFRWGAYVQVKLHRTTSYIMVYG